MAKKKQNYNKLAKPKHAAAAPKDTSAKAKPKFAVNVAYVNIAVTAVMAFVIIGVLALGNANYLRKIEALSLFVSTHDYYAECMRMPGGWLTWISTFLTQTFYHPWLGAVVYAVILTGIALSALKAFRLPAYVYPALMVLPSAILLALLNLGYVIFSLKTPGYAFLLPMGVLLCVLTFWCYRSIRFWWLRLIIVVVLPTAGYVVAGTYALVATAMCVIYQLLSLKGEVRQWWQSAVIIVVGSLLIWLMPHYMSLYSDWIVPMPMVYRCSLPRFYEGEGGLWTPYIFVGIVIMLLSALSALSFDKMHKVSVPKLITSSAVGTVAIVCIFVCKYSDSNFRLTLDLDRALWQQQWQEAADLMADFDDEPTRLNVILGDMALIRNGEAADRLFTLPIGSAPYTTGRDLRATHDAGSMMFSYHMGLINYAYRWAIESKVEYGMNAEQLKFMTKCALLNGDYEVARKCIDNLRLTAFHGDWADQYMAYIDDPSMIDQDAELKAVKSLISDRNVFIEDRGQLEGYVWEFLANAESGNKDVLELSLVSALVCRQIEAFAQRLPYYARLHESLPVHFQEGILMWSRVHKNTGFRQYKIDQEVKDRFKSFLKMQEQLSNLSLDQQAELMRPAFGDTFWYYALFMRNLKVI